MNQTVKVKQSIKLKINKVDNQMNDEELTECLPKNSNPFIMGMIASKGKGKSTVLKNLLYGYYRKYFQNIYFVCPSKDKKFDELIEELSEDNRYFNLEDQKFDDVISHIYDDLKKKVENDDEGPNLLILDDCISFLKYSKILDLIVCNSRHINLSIFYCSQYYRSVNSILRSNTDIYCVWPTYNSLEMKKYQDEMNIDFNKFKKYMDHIIDVGNHSFLTVSFLKSKPKCYINFDEVVEE